MTFGIDTAGNRQAQPSDEAADGGVGFAFPGVGPAYVRLLPLARLLGRAAARRWLAELHALATESIAPADNAEPQPDAGSIGGGRSS